MAAADSEQGPGQDILLAEVCVWDSAGIAEPIDSAVAGLHQRSHMALAAVGEAGHVAVEDRTEEATMSNHQLSGPVLHAVTALTWFPPPMTP